MAIDGGAPLHRNGWWVEGDRTSEAQGDTSGDSPDSVDRLNAALDCPGLSLRRQDHLVRAIDAILLAAHIDQRSRGLKSVLVAPHDLLRHTNELRAFSLGAHSVVLAGWTRHPSLILADVGLGDLDKR